VIRGCAGFVICIASGMNKRRLGIRFIQMVRQWEIAAKKPIIEM